MKNIVVCFDSTPPSATAGPTNVAALRALLDDTTDQPGWYHPGLPASGWPAPGRRRAIAEARAGVLDAYRYLAGAWRPGDRIHLFGAGRGAYCARALTRLLGTVGLPGDAAVPVLDYVLATYALPRTTRTPQEWRRVRRLTARLAGRDEAAVPVHYLGLWDTLPVAGLPRLSGAELPTNVGTARHAVAIDGRPATEPLTDTAPGRIEQVWFRGSHRDITGDPGASRPLAGIALDWVLDGAERAGLALRPQRPAPVEFDALAGSVRPLALRRLPRGAAVHASVRLYVHQHPQYWRRLPVRFDWADLDWAARGERLAAAGPPRAASFTWERCAEETMDAYRRALR